MMREEVGSRRLSLDALGVIEGTDKSSLHHDYLRHYERIFAQFRNEPINIIEVGVARGASLRIWSEYFRSANIVGVDVRPECKRYEQDRISIEIGSQDDPEFLTSICTRYPPTIIIDDGSHRADHVLFAFERTFPMLLAGGFYVIEDLFFHVGPTERQNRGFSAISPADYIAELIRTLFAGNLPPDENHGFKKYLFEKTDHIEIIRQAAVFRKQSDQYLELSVSDADRLIDSIESADSLDSLALLLMRRGGNLGRAEMAVRKAMRAAPDIADLLTYRLSMVMDMQGRWSEAIDLAKRAVELGPRSGTFTHHLDRLLGDQVKRERESSHDGGSELREG